MRLTDEQAETMAVCVMCQCPLEVAAVKESLQNGGNPATQFCGTCGTGGERLHEAILRLATAKSGDLLAERCERAGLEEHFGNLATEINLRSDHRQN